MKRFFIVFVLSYFFDGGLVSGSTLLKGVV
jgi:hypothetical protein